MALGPAANLPPHIWLEPVPLSVSPRFPFTVPFALSLAPALLLAGCDRGAPPNSQQAGAPAAPGHAAATPKPRGAESIDRSHAGEAMPALDLINPATQAPFDRSTIAGRPVLLNLWATWCAPCVKEMPLLDALAGEERGLAVVTASQDIGGAEKVVAFFAKEKFERLKPWLDKDGELGFKFGGGLPVSILYDASGKEVWRVTGDLDWADPQVRGAIDEALPAG